MTIFVTEEDVGQEKDGVGGEGNVLDAAQAQIDNCEIHGWVKYKRRSLSANKRQYCVLSSDGN